MLQRLDPTMVGGKTLVLVSLGLVLITCLGGIIAHGVLINVRGPDGWWLRNQAVPLWFCIIAAFSAVQAGLELLQPAQFQSWRQVF